MMPRYSEVPHTSLLTKQGGKVSSGGSFRTFHKPFLFCPAENKEDLLPGPQTPGHAANHTIVGVKHADPVAPQVANN